MTNSGSMLLLKKPFQMTAALAYKHTRGRVGPIEVEKRRAGCVQLPRALIEFLAAAMRADHRLPRDLVTVIARQPALEPIHEPHELTSCGSISGHLVTIPYQIIKHIPTSALLEA